MGRKIKFILVALFGLISLDVSADPVINTGAGSTFFYPILSIWSHDYGVQTGNKLVYEAVGSNAGIVQIKAGAVDFGASDMPLKPEELEQAGLGQFPAVIGGVVPVVNLDGVAPGQMRFTGALLADIYLGKINKWNDQAIKALNPDIALPDEKINVAYRSDGSGTTFNWVNFLAKRSPEWKEKIGEGATVNWLVGTGAKGSDGMAAYVLRNKYSIGYVEYAYVGPNKMKYCLIENKAGKFVKPDINSFQAAAAHADWKSDKDFYLILTDSPEEDAYPVTATTFVIMHKQPEDSFRSRMALAFFKWAFESGQSQALKLNYVPLPAPLVQLIESYWKAEFKFQVAGLPQ